MTIVDRILALSGPLPSVEKHRHWLEQQTTVAFEARLKQLERENTEPQQRYSHNGHFGRRPWHTWQKIAAATVDAIRAAARPGLLPRRPSGLPARTAAARLAGGAEPARAPGD